jgi:molybdopterin-guanine dinucleotide biosynthesis adapter protein
MGKPYIFQIVGYQNSGKTTFLKKLLSQLHKEGYKTVTMKHHGHGGKPDIVEEKDSSQHILSGAAASLVEGGGRVLVQVEGWEVSIEDKLKLLSFFQPDIILIEGYKRELYPKLVFLRDNRDLHLLDELKNIKAVIYQDPLNKHIGVPMFNRDEEHSLKWLLEYIRSKV